jgi:hypothetical protein
MSWAHAANGAPPRPAALGFLLQCVQGRMVRAPNRTHISASIPCAGACWVWGTCTPLSGRLSVAVRDPCVSRPGRIRLAFDSRSVSIRFACSHVGTGLKPVSTNTPPPGVTGGFPRGILHKHGLFEFVRALKTFSSRKINVVRGTVGQPVWQPRFHDHIIRDDQALQQIRLYIRNNPKSWEHDPVY